MPELSLKILSTLAVKGVIDEITPTLERAAGCPLDVAYDPTAVMLGKIRGGAKGDAAILTEQGIEQLTAEGRLIPGSRVDLAHSLIGLAVVVVAGWMPVRALLETTSTEAVINARLITLRAPIEGQVGPLAAVAAGSEVQPGAVLVSIVNPRAERGRLDDLRRLVDEFASEIKTLIVRRSDLAVLHQDLTGQTRAFRAARQGQLEARIAELGSDNAAAEARREEAQQALARARMLEGAGTGTKVSLEKATRDATVAVQTLAALGHRRTALEVEISALRNGIYVGDSYNDRPQSLQRADDIALRLSELGADIDHREARLAMLRAELAGENERFAQRAAASLVSPVRGSIWEIMTAPGESVVRGQDLVRVLDCSGLVQIAAEAAGLACPRDSDMQQAELGSNVLIPETLDGLVRGDLVFWKGHVGVMVDGLMLVHANAHHMAVAVEPLQEAAARIARAGSTITAVSTIIEMPSIRQPRMMYMIVRARTSV